MTKNNAQIEAGERTHAEVEENWDMDNARLEGEAWQREIGGELPNWMPGGTTAFGFLNDLSGCAFHFSEDMRDLTIRANDGGKIGLQFTDKIAALRINREQTPEVIAAAPELLEACKAVLETWAPSDEDKNADQVQNLLIAAILKAEGK